MFYIIMWHICHKISNFDVLPILQIGEKFESPMEVCAYEYAYN